MADPTDDNLNSDRKAGEDVSPEGSGKAGGHQGLPYAAGHDRHLPASALQDNAPSNVLTAPIEILPVPGLWRRS